MDYVDPFKSLNDIKRQEREALLNNPASQQHKSTTTSASLISRRDYFAAAALQGIIAHQSSIAAVEKAVMIADLMIAVLNETVEQKP